MNTKMLGIPLLLLFIVGCATVNMGRDFDLSQIDTKIQIGKSTQAEISALVGPPLSRGVEHRQGKVLQEWVWYSGSGKLPSMQHARLKLLQVRFNSDGVVESYNWSE